MVNNSSIINKLASATLLVILSLNLMANNAVRIKSIQASSSANYESQKGGRSLEKIFDGKKAVRTPMWLDEGTLGWQNVNQITFDIELDKLCELERIELSTAANESVNVLNPLSISVFVSVDGLSYQFVKDISDRSKDNFGHYRTYTLGESKINQSAKFIKLIVYPQGRLFFTDEIQVFGKENKKLTKPKIISNIGEVSKENVETQKNKALLLNLTSNKNVEIIREIIASDHIDKAQFDRYKQRISGEKNIITNEITVKAIKNTWNINGDVPIYHTTDDIKIAGVQNLSSYLLIEVANGKAKNIQTSIRIETKAKFKIHQLSQVVTRELKTVYDPLLPIDINNFISLKSGEKKYLLIEFYDLKDENIKGQMFLDGENDHSLAFTLNNYNLGISKKFVAELDFGVNVWPYYSYKFYKGKESIIKRDLNNHYANVLPLAPWTLGVGGAVNRKEILKNLSFRNENDIILLFLNQRSLLSNPGDYLEPNWMKRFLKWYDELMALLKSQNIPLEKVYLYPYDEVQSKEVKYFNKFVENIKIMRPEAQIYLTIFNGSVLKNITNQVDLLQVVTTRNDLSTLKLPTKYWIYDIMDDAKSTDTFSRYRIQPWLAYYYDAEGVGFWNYADMQGESIWDDTDGGKGDFNVVYDYQNAVIPSIRWEAFKNGVEDYYILKAYEARFGQAKLKSLMKPLMVSKDINPTALESLRVKLIKGMVQD